MSNNRKPTHRAYVVIGEGDDANWHEIGAAWPHRDSDGFSITLSSIPLNGQIVIRTVKEKAANDGGQQ